MKLRISIWLLALALSFSATSQAQSTSEPTKVSSWEELREAFFTDMKDNILISGNSIIQPTDNILTTSLYTTIKGEDENGNTLTLTATTLPICNFSIMSFTGGAMLSRLNFTGDITKWRSLIESAVNQTVAISSCKFENLISTGIQTNITYSPSSFGATPTASSFEIDNSSFTNNENTCVWLANNSVIRNSSFTNNRCILTASRTVAWGSILCTTNTGAVIGCDFSNNYVSRETGANEEATGGAAFAYGGGTYVDSNFTDNYAMGSGSMGGAIYSELSDGFGTINLAVASRDRDVVFSGNKVEVTQIDADNKALDGYANAIWVKPYWSQESYYRVFSVALDSSEGRSLTFFDPIVIESQCYVVGKQHNVSLNGESSSTGSIIFSGAKYQTAADDARSRISRFSNSVGITQEKGKVIITEKAIVGASMDSTTEENLKVGALNYVQKKGSLEISNGGHLMAGSYLVGDGTANSGFNGSTISAGNGALLTTGWMFIENGVSFDLKPYDPSTSGLVVNIVNGAPNTLGSGTIYDESGVRISLGGTLGISNNLNYSESRWENPLEFLLFDFSSLTDKSQMAGDFTGIEITGTGRSGNMYGHWKLKWDDGETITKDRLYAVWSPGASVPEPSSAALALLGLGSLLIRRSRKA